MLGCSTDEDCLMPGEHCDPSDGKCYGKTKFLLGSYYNEKRTFKSFKSLLHSNISSSSIHLGYFGVYLKKNTFQSVYLMLTVHLVNYPFAPMLVYV